MGVVVRLRLDVRVRCRQRVQLVQCRQGPLVPQRAHQGHEHGVVEGQVHAVDVPTSGEGHDAGAMTMSASARNTTGLDRDGAGAGDQEEEDRCCDSRDECGL